MQTRLRLPAYACVTLMLFATAAASHATAKENIIYIFNGQSQGLGPQGLRPDGADGFYGATIAGGENGQGTIFQLSPGVDGWTETVLYNFKGGSGDGASPAWMLVTDSAGNIYGVALGGGNGYGIDGAPGCGVVFELSRSSSGWSEKVIHFFSCTGTPGPPSSPLTIDWDGNLYGEAGGGISSNGTVFELSRTSTGWSAHTLYSFKGANDGIDPSGGLILDGRGNLYGTTVEGGVANDGTVFELQHATDNRWTESILYTFQSATDGMSPEAALVMDRAGNLYGTALSGGDINCGDGYGCGEVFELSHSGDDAWSKTALYVFAGAPDGHAPLAALTLDEAGDLFGTTMNGGESNTGALFELQRNSGGSFKESILYSFDNGDGGGYPSNPLTLVDGILFSTASGGEDAGGVAFSFRDVADRRARMNRRRP